MKTADLYLKSLCTSIPLIAHLSKMFDRCLLQSYSFPPTHFWEIGTFRNGAFVQLTYLGVDRIYIYIFVLCCFTSLRQLVLHLLTFWFNSSPLNVCHILPPELHILYEHLISENVYDDHRIIFFLSLSQHVGIHPIAPELLALTRED